MTKQELKKQVADVVRGTLRKEAYYCESGDALLGIGDVIDCISIDRERIRNHIRQALSEGHNPLNAILGLIGLRIVSPERAAQKLVSTIGEESCAEVIEMDAEGNEAAANIDSFFCVDKEKAAVAVERMALHLYQKAEGNSRIIDSMKEQMEKSHSEMERIRGAFNQVHTDYRENLHQVAVWAQRILIQDSDDPMTEKVMSLLGDMDISVYWDVGDLGFSASAMFTTLRTSHDCRGRNQPCLVKDGRILLKGLLLIDEDPT